MTVPGVGGAPLKFQSVEDLERGIEEYFQSLRVFVDEVEIKPDGTRIERKVEVEQEPPTMAGLAHHLGVVRKTIYNYAEREDFTLALARAKNRIAMYAERALYHRDKTRGAMFALEVNHGYGKEDSSAGAGGGLVVQVIPPAAGEASVAIPKWNPEGTSDD